MKIKGLDGALYALDTGGGSKDQNIKSAPQRRAEELLRSIYPRTTFLTEVTARLDRRTTVRLDIFITVFRLAIEIDGRQHTEYTPFFHKTEMEFFRAQQRDSQKEEWCKINGITLVRLKSDERDGEWERRIRDAVEHLS